MSYDNDFTAEAEPNLTTTRQLTDLHLKAKPEPLQMVYQTPHEKWNSHITITNAKVSHSYVDCLLAERVSFKRTFCEATWRHGQKSWQQVSDADKVHQQRGALVTNGHFRVLSASNMATKLDRHLCQSFPRKETGRILTFSIQRLNVWQVWLSDATFFPLMPVHKEAKPVVRSLKTCTPEQWKALNINELSCKVLDLCMESRFPPPSPFKEGIFPPPPLFNKHSFELWQHLKKAWICFQSKVWRCSPLRCFTASGVPVIISSTSSGSEFRCGVVHFEMQKAVEKCEPWSKCQRSVILGGLLFPLVSTNILTSVARIPHARSHFHFFTRFSPKTNTHSKWNQTWRVPC